MDKTLDWWQKIEVFLRERTDGVKHSGRTLFDHLTGTHALLAKQGAPEHVCLAGLFHSIYGTNIFRHETMLISQRNVVIALIGPDAERLAYIFCSCGRPKALVNAAESGPPYSVINRRNGESIQLSTRDMFDLLDIELANLEDQGGGPMLQRVLEAMMSVKHPA
jgi:hypothetical protein